MKNEINKTFTDISNALRAGCFWDVDHIDSNVTVLFNSSQEEKTIQGIQLMGSDLFVKVVDEEDIVGLDEEDIVYQTT